MGSGALQALRDLMGNDNPRSFWHLACSCSAQITMCGMYTPEVVGVEMGMSDDPACCPQCPKVWEATGCGRCPCTREHPCVGCLAACAG